LIDLLNVKKNVNKHIKSIVKLNVSTIYNNPHFSTNDWVDTNFKIENGGFNEYGDCEIAQINHYYCKNTIEFLNKINKSRVDRLINDLNVEDLSAFNFKYNKIYI
jgi:hypothetical protein